MIKAAVLRTLTILSVTGVVACDAPADVESRASALGVSGWPQGLVCGLGYYRNGVDVVAGVCEGLTTAHAQFNICNNSSSIEICQPGTGFPCAPGFGLAADGDRGLCAPWGFYHQQLFTSTGGVTSQNANQLLLPKGTACGFKDNCNDPALTCLGFDPAVDCPLGWARKVASDSNAPSSCNNGPGGYVWCEYQDPFNLCTGACQLTNQPIGIVCGLDDNDRHNGQCLGQSTDTSCPQGWVRHSFFDDGRSVGHGLAWCTKS